MERLSLLEFRHNARKVIRRVQAGARMVLTVRGRPVMRLEPVTETEISPDDPFYRLADRPAVKEGESMTNEEMDRVIYGA